MVRATSSASSNAQKAGRVQRLVKADVDSQSICFGGTHRYTQRIPAVVASSDIGTVMADLLDRTTQHDLERRGVLNRYPAFGRLAVMKMSGNGNCLLHAISTYMWGIQDSDQTLQQLLCRALTEPTNLSRSLRDRFMEHLMGNTRRQSSQEDLRRKWEAVLSMVSSAFTPQVDNDLLLKAFEVYIFTMAQILRRPIVVLAEDVPLTREGGSFSLSGIYLPLQWPAEECVKNPIMLGYHNQQFYPLLSTQPPQQATSGPTDAVPLVRQNGESLPVHLLLPAEAAHVQEYVNQHIHTTQFQDQQGNSMVAARMGTLTPPDEYNLLLDVFQQAAEGANPTEAREASLGPTGLENRNGAAGNQGASVFCTQGAEGLTSQGAELDQQMLRMSIQKEAVSQGNSHPANASTQLPCTREAMMFTSSPHNSDDIPHNLDVHNMAAASEQSIQTSHSTIQGKVNNYRATSSQQEDWQQNNVLPGDVSAAAESIQDESQASSSRANGRSSRAANDNRVQWEATGAKPKQPSGSKSKEGSRKMGNCPARDNSICKTTGCPGKAVPSKGGHCKKCYTRKSREERETRNKRLSLENPSADRPAPHERQARKTSSSAGQQREQQISGVGGQRSVSSAPTTGRNSSIPQGRQTSKEQMSMQPVNTPTSTANTSGSSSATVNSTPMRPQVPQATDPASRPETAFLSNSGPPSSTIYASSSGQSSSTSTHGTEPQSTNNVYTGTLRMHHNAGEEPLGTSLYHARTTADGAVQENHPYIPADHLVKCSAPNCYRMVNKDISDSLCQVCHQVLGQINQASLPNNGTLNLGQGSSVGTNTRRAATDADAAVMASDVTSPKYKDSAANLPMRNQPAVHRPPELQSAHQRAYQQQPAEVRRQSTPPPGLSTDQLASQPCAIRGCRNVGIIKKKYMYFCGHHFQDCASGASNSNSFNASGNISLHADPEPQSQPESMPKSISCNNYNVFERGSIQTYINNPSPSDNSTFKPPCSAQASVPFPDQNVDRTRARGSPSHQNGQSPPLRNSPSPPLHPRQGPSLHDMYSRTTVNGPPPSYGLPSSQGYTWQPPRSQWNNLSAPLRGVSHETKPFSQHPIQDPTLHSNPTRAYTRNAPSRTVSISTCNMRCCNQQGDPAYSGFCPQCYDWIQRNRRS